MAVSQDDEAASKGGLILERNAMNFSRRRFLQCPHPLRLLRERTERPCHRCATEKGDDIAPLHSITSSAMASNIGGNSRPIALAVCRLTTRSNFVGSRTGMSAGFLPLRMLPA